MSKFRKTGVAVALWLATGGAYAQTPESFVTQEFRASKALELIRAQYAYAAGYTGKGVVIAILDSGLDIHHPEFAGRVSPYMYNYIPGFGPTDVYSELGVGTRYHGTHVAGLAAAARDGKGMHGVAYNAIVLPLRTDFDDDQLDLAFDRAIQAGAKVLNGSYGADPIWVVDEPARPDRPVLDFQVIEGDVDDEYRMLRRAADADVLMVFAAGNSREEHPGGYTSLPIGAGMLPLITPSNTDLADNNPIYRFLDDFPDSGPVTFLDEEGADEALWAEVRKFDFSDLKGSLIAVVATDPAGKIASFSNLCGAAAAWCLAAPGGSYEDQVWSTVPYSGYGMSQGTSMASPVVAGAAAIMREIFPYMTARQVIEIMLTSADNASNVLWADKDTYGRGMLDLGTAINGPVIFGDAAFDSVFSINTQGYDTFWRNDISGGGGLQKAGAGTLTMTGNSSYTGKTTIDGGKLVVNGSIASSPLEVGKAAALGGAGTVGTTNLRGRVTPGNSVGTLTVAGDYTQHSGSVFELELGADGTFDKVIVTGAADIKTGSELKVIGLKAAHLGQDFAFIEADSWVGTAFSSAGLDRLFIGLAPRLSGTVMSLDVQRNTTSFADLAHTGNQRAVAAAADGQGVGGAAYNEVVILRDPSVAPSMYDALSGEMYASTASALFDASALLRHAGLARSRQAASNLHAVGQQLRQGTSARTAVWGQTVGSWGQLGASADAYRLDRSTHGLMFGVDTELTDSVRGGVVLGYTDSSFKGDAQGRVRADGFHAMAYADQRWQDWSLRGGLAYSWYSLDTRRSLNFANWGTATSRTHAQASQVFAELAYGIEVGGIGVEPYAGLAYTHLRQHGFSEDNSPVALQASSANHGLTISTLGIRGSVLLEQGRTGALQATAGLGWRHAMGDIQPTRNLQFATGPTYQVVGVPVARNAMVADLGLEWSTSARSRVSITYSGQIAGRTQDHGLQASVRWVF